VEVSNDKQTFWLVVGKFLALIVTFAIPLFLTRVLSKEEYGFYTQFNAVLYFFVLFFSFGINTNLYYFFPTVESKKKKAVIFQTALFFFIFSLFSIIFIFIPFLSSFFLGNDLLQNYKYVLYFLTIIITVTNIIHPLYVINKDVQTSIWFPAFQIVIKAIFIFIFFLIIPGIRSVINAIIISSVVVLLIVLNYIRKQFKTLSGSLVDKTLAKDQLNYILPVGVAIAIKSFSQRFDKLVSISLLTTTAYASYSVAFFGIPGITQIYDSISQVTVVDMTKSFNENKKHQALEHYKRMVIRTLSFSIPIILIVSLFAKQIIVFLFTEKYSDSVLLFQMYLTSFFFVMIGAGLILRASGNTRYSMRAFMFSSIITIPLTYFLIKNYGSMGAMTGALMSIIFPKLYQVKKEIEIVDTNLKNFLPWKQIGKVFMISLLLLTPFIFINEMNEIGIWVAIIFLMIYLLLVYILEIRMDLFIIDKKKLFEIKDSIFKRIF